MILADRSITAAVDGRSSAMSMASAGGTGAGNPTTPAMPTAYPTAMMAQCRQRSAVISHLALALARSLRRGASPSWTLRPRHQMLDEVLEHWHIELVADFLPVALGLHEASIAENRQMTRDRRPGRLEMIRYGTRGFRTGSQESEDLTPGLVSQGPKDRISFSRHD